MILSLKHFQFYKQFAYHISLLWQFVSLHSQNRNSDENSSIPSSVHGGNVWNTMRKKRGLGASGHSKDGSGHGGKEYDFSTGKGVGMGMRRIVTATGSLSAMNGVGGEQK
jgi:hypothetical protein